MKWFDAMCEEPFDAVAKVVCILPHCGKKCYRPCEDFGHGEKVTFVRQLNFGLSAFVALTTSSIHIAVLLRPGTFPFWYRHRACDLRVGAVFFVGHRLKSS